MQRGGNHPNTRQLCSKNRTESELRNSTGDIRIRMSLPALSSISLFFQILRHSRPTEAPQHSQNSWVKFHRAHTFCFHGLQSGDHTTVCCCSVNARHNLSRGFPSPRCCVGVLEVFGLLSPGSIILQKPKGWIHNT